MKKASFLCQPRPLLCAMVQEKTPQTAITVIMNSLYDGAEAFGIQLEYLENLNRRYDEFIYTMYKGRVIVIEKDNLDYQNNPKDFAQIVDRIDATLFGLFPE